VCVRVCERACLYVLSSVERDPGARGAKSGCVTTGDCVWLSSSDREGAFARARACACACACAMTNRAFRLPDNNGSPFTNYHAKRPGQYWIDQASGEVVPVGERLPTA
jgi:hypothetical protein